ncbi:hypothetical protein C2S51_023427 [Perilla frutescens var. frutescens]|nr:hypothetical protein C2S51_023427 [Perilla frutescens var. frutescens]
MDFLSLPSQIALLFLATIFIYYFKSSRATKNKKTGATTLPEPPGAWPLIGHLHLLGGRGPVCRTLGAMADEHGPIFSLRLGCYSGVVVSNWEMIKECLTTNDRVFVTRPSMAIGKYLGYQNGSFGLSPYGHYWRNVRKMVTVDLFTARRLHDLRHVRAAEVDGFMKELWKCSGEESKKVVALSSWIDHLTFNIIMRMLAGKRFSFSDGDNEDMEFKKAIKKALYLGGVFVYSDAIPSLEWLDIRGYIKSMKQTFKKVDKVFEDWLQERIQTRMHKNDEISESSDFMDVMLSTIEENEVVDGYSRETVIKATILVSIIARSVLAPRCALDQRAVPALAGDVRAHHRAEPVRAGAECATRAPQHAVPTCGVHLRAAESRAQAQRAGKDRWVQESDINSLNYLQAIFKETLRLYPSGPLAGPREALEDCHISGYFVPKGTRLIVNLWKLHRDPNVWSAPDEFRPERFLNENKHVNFKGQCFEFILFSSGRRMCPGIAFGLQVIYLTLARLLQGFDLSMQTGEAVDMGEGLGIALPKLKPLDIVLTPRLTPKLYENL